MRYENWWFLPHKNSYRFCKLEKPVSELQNALSNNFFANTEVYNENSVTDTKLVLESENAQGAILDGITQANSQFIDEYDSLKNTVDGLTGGALK